MRVFGSLVFWLMLGPMLFVVSSQGLLLLPTLGARVIWAPGEEPRVATVMFTVLAIATHVIGGVVTWWAWRRFRDGLPGSMKPNPTPSPAKKA